MASALWIAFAAWVLYEACGFIYDEQHNHGLGPAIFASICTAARPYDTTDFVKGDVFHEFLAFSMIAWPGAIWGIVFYWLLSTTEDKATCCWLTISPIFVIVLCMSLLAKYIPLREPFYYHRAGGGLGAIGVLAGHFSSKTAIVYAINDYPSALPLHAYPMFKAMAGAATMFVSVARMVQSHSQAAKELGLTKTARINSLMPINLPPFWGLPGPLYVLLWTFGLALCITSMDTPQARAILVSTSILIVLTVMSLPPFMGKIWARSYDDLTRLLLFAHVGSVLICCFYYTAVEAFDARQRSAG